MRRSGSIDFYGRRRLWYAVSIAVIVLGAISLALPSYGLRLGIDFTGGTLLETRFERTDVTTAEVRQVLGPLGLGEPIIQQAVDDPARFIIRTAAYAEEDRQAVQNALTAGIGPHQVQRFEGIAAVVGRELTQRAVLAVAVASALMLLYITVRFEFRFGVAAIVALLHDVAVTVSAFSLLRREVSVTFVAALLTVVGYSINDSIVIFDRIRENLRARAHGPGDYGPLVNRSLNETLTRSINTSATTLLAILAVFLFGGRTIRDFALALMIGMVAGTYSSIFIASPIWATWRESAARAARRAAPAAPAVPAAGRTISAARSAAGGTAIGSRQPETASAGGPTGPGAPPPSGKSKSRSKRRRR
ncbi:MAG: protein translocase subunit SecF [Bacillota bacterium]|nr:protein translocase subunit SecF [Bacillota bacterium]